MQIQKELGWYESRKKERNLGEEEEDSRKARGKTLGFVKGEGERRFGGTENFGFRFG